MMTKKWLGWTVIAFCVIAVLFLLLRQSPVDNPKIRTGSPQQHPMRATAPEPIEGIVDESESLEGGEGDPLDELRTQRIREIAEELRAKALDLQDKAWELRDKA